MRVSLVEFAQFASEIRQIRRAVFQVEQQVAEALDFDGLDATAAHILLWMADKPVGTARIRLLTPTVAKIERVALLAEYRGQGLGQRLMQQVIEVLDDWRISEAQLYAQSQTVSFYRKLGFVPQGEPFYEAGILHVAMHRRSAKQVH